MTALQVFGLNVCVEVNASVHRCSGAENNFRRRVNEERRWKWRLPSFSPSPSSPQPLPRGTQLSAPLESPSALVLRASNQELPLGVTCPQAEPMTANQQPAVG
ncbi:hypothetical protein AOLI_G00310650 [Acnodon oligacanthus]